LRPHKDNLLSQPIQILQVILFLIPILSLFVIGGLILIKPVCLIHRRWFLVVFLPLLIANLLAILQNYLMIDGSAAIDWQLWLILTADLLLIMVITWTFRGWSVYGLDGDKVQDLVLGYLQSQGLDFDVDDGEISTLFGRISDARLINVHWMGKDVVIQIGERFNEVSIRTGTPRGACFLKGALSKIRCAQTIYAFKRHAVGILYIVLGAVFAVLSWIFFFEPRILLIE